MALALALAAAPAGAGGASASFGTVASVNGKTIDVTDTSGNTVKVKVTSSTRITRNRSVSRHAIRPGDTIIVTGHRGSGGTDQRDHHHGLGQPQWRLELRQFGLGRFRFRLGLRRGRGANSAVGSLFSGG